MEIYATRHGQTKLNVKGLINRQIRDELTSEGIEQAKAAAETVLTTVK
jgi:broad specificity phosphatase PhoE